MGHGRGDAGIAQLRVSAMKSQKMALALRWLCAGYAPALKFGMYFQEILPRPCIYDVPGSFGLVGHGRGDAGMAQLRAKRNDITKAGHPETLRFSTPLTRFARLCV